MKQTEQEKIDEFIKDFMQLTEREKYLVCQAIIHKFYTDGNEHHNREKEKPRP